MPHATATKESSNATTRNGGGENQLRHSPMMERLLDDANSGTDIGHYGRLVTVMVGRFFMEPHEMAVLLAKQPDQDEDTVMAMINQVVDKSYSPPRRERILEWQAKQDYQIIENPDDPDEGNLYRDLTFPDQTYDHISEYHEEQVEAHAGN